MFLSWYVFPVTYTQAQPYDLSPRAKDDLLRMIASTYMTDLSFERANQRLYYLQVPDVKTRLTELAQNEPNVMTQQALVKLRLDLDHPAVARIQPTFTPRPTRDLTPSPRVTVIVLEPTAIVPTGIPPTAAPTPIPPTSEPNQNAPGFELREKRALDCAATGGQAVIQVEVQDANGKGMRGILVEVNSAHGNEQFYTGFKPEYGNGFGDVTVVRGTYSVHLVENARSSLVGDLRIEANAVECTSNPVGTEGWYLVFRQIRTP